MTDIIDFKKNTVGENVKRVMLPFGGFYQSLYEDVINSQITDMHEEDACSEYLEALVNTIDYKSQYQRVADGFADYLNEKISHTFGAEVAFTQTQVHPLTLQNTGDEISSAVDVTQLPELQCLQNFCDAGVGIDFKQSLAKIATDKLSSCSGFHSSWDADISQLFDVPYAMWESVYIECLLIAMVQAIHIDEGGSEQDQWEHNITDFESRGFMDYAHSHGLMFVDNLYAPTCS